jgi:hypothetical protein
VRVVPSLVLFTAGIALIAQLHFREHLWRLRLWNAQRKQVARTAKYIGRK